MVLIDSPENYQEMLKKIAWWDFYYTLILSVILYYTDKGPWDALLSGLPLLNSEIDIAGVKLKLLVVVLPALLALGARVTILHERISRVLRLRAKYSDSYILNPLAIGVGLDPGMFPPDFYKKFGGKLMDSVFYKYAGSRDSEPAIGKHLIVMTLDALSWYWIAIEAILFTILYSVLAFVAGQAEYGNALVVFCWILFCIAAVLHGRCVERTGLEVDAILSDDRRKAEIKAAFDAIHSQAS